MNKKRLLLVLPGAIFPYMILLTLAFIFLSPRLSFFSAMMEKVPNILFIIIGILFIYILIAVILTILCFFLAIFKNWGSLSMAKTVMLIKLIQIPAYVLIFVLGILFMLTIFTFAFTIFLFVFDCLALFMSGLLNTAAVISAIREKKTTFAASFWVILLQFIFCADVVASAIFYTKLNKRSTGQITSA